MRLVIERNLENIGNMRIYRMARVAISFAQRMSDKPCCETRKLSEQRLQLVRSTSQEAACTLNGSLSRDVVQREKANERWRACCLAASADHKVCGPATHSALSPLV